MTIFHGIRCDCCDVDFAESRGNGRVEIHAMRNQAKAKGWRTGVSGMKDRHQAGYRDFCPACVIDWCKQAGEST